MHLVVKRTFDPVHAIVNFLLKRSLHNSYVLVYLRDVLSEIEEFRRTRSDKAIVSKYRVYQKVYHIRTFPLKLSKVCLKKKGEKRKEKYRIEEFDDRVRNRVVSRKKKNLLSNKSSDLNIIYSNEENININRFDR